MPDRVKEKLVELIMDSGMVENKIHCQILSEELIANGVTVLDEPIKMVIPEGVDEKTLMEMIRNAPIQIFQDEPVQQWIPVTEGMPKLILCGAGTAYSEAVNVLTSGRKVLTAIWDGFDWICDAEFWDAEDEEITHWTPVLLPLPQPPKGERNGNQT